MRGIIKFKHGTKGLGMKTILYSATLILLTHAPQALAKDLQMKRIEILDSNGWPSTLQIFKGRKLFLSTRADNPNCHNSGIEAVLNATTRYTVRCKNDPKRDAGMKSSAFATYDGRTIRIQARSETTNGVFFTYAWTMEISGESCSGGVHIESTFGTFDKSIVKCAVAY